MGAEATEFVVDGTPVGKGFDDYRDLHVLAGGVPRIEKLHGRDHIVVPVVALMEGVIHAINADTPEFVPSTVLSSAAHTFNGRPLVLGHPTMNGRQISANAPGVIERQGFGQIFESKPNGTKLGMEAWIDPQRLEALNQQDLLARVRAGKPIEVSVGAYVKTSGRRGTHNGRAFANEWSEVQGDHLAFLPNGRGACSLEMGCGACRAAEGAPVLYSLEGAEPVALGGPGSGNFGHAGRPGKVGGSGEGEGEKSPVSDEDKMKNTSEYADIEPPPILDSEASSKGHTSAKTLEGRIDDLEKAHYDEAARVVGKKGLISVADSNTLYPDPTDKYSYVISETSSGTLMSQVFHGSGNIKHLWYDGEKPLKGKKYRGASMNIVKQFRMLLGARNSMKDVEIIQGVHDHAVKLGATCDRGNYKMMEASLRAATIKNEGGKYVLYTRDGSRKLGTHDTRAEAEAQEKAIEAAKKRRSAELAGTAVPEHTCSCKH